MKTRASTPCLYCQPAPRRLPPLTWFLAASPMSRSESVKATYEGVVRLPCAGEEGQCVSQLPGLGLACCWGGMPSRHAPGHWQ